MGKIQMIGLEEEMRTVKGHSQKSLTRLGEMGIRGKMDQRIVKVVRTSIDSRVGDQKRRKEQE